MKNSRGIRIARTCQRLATDARLIVLEATENDRLGFEDFRI